MDYKKLVKLYEKKLIDNLGKFIAINSVYDENTKSEVDPFGKGVSKALDFIYQLAKQDGFEVTNYNNMIVEILCGQGDKNITILAHADVVPEGTGWQDPPYKMVEKDGVLYARGVADDKGPLLASYYALKALRDNKLLGNYQVRLLVGGNEESGSLGMEYYFHTLKKYQPTLGFSPDSAFPLTFAEKGILNFKITKKLDNINDLIYVKGGVASNSVIERCEVKMKDNVSFKNYLKGHNYEYTFENGCFVFHGLAAHGSVPWMGRNAGVLALTALANYLNNPDLRTIVTRFTDCKGRGVNCYYQSENMGETSLNVGLINIDEDNFSMVINYRYVETADKETIIKDMKNTLKPFDVELLADSPLLYYDKNCTLIQTLLHAYQEETGDIVTPILSSGGGTYAKEADNVVAFGMEFPGWDSNMHSPGEKLKKDDLFLGMAIYARAIYELGEKLDEN